MKYSTESKSQTLPLSPRQRYPIGILPTVPGSAVILSLLAWMLVSAGFSYYVEHIAGYTLLYGSVAAVVVTLLWLYMSGLVLIMGAEFNAMLHRDRRGRGERKKGP